MSDEDSPTAEISKSAPPILGLIEILIGVGVMGCLIWFDSKYRLAETGGESIGASFGLVALAATLLILDGGIRYIGAQRLSGMIEVFFQGITAATKLSVEQPAGQSETRNALETLEEVGEAVRELLAKERRQSVSVNLPDTDQFLEVVSDSVRETLSSATIKAIRAESGSQSAERSYKETKGRLEDAIVKLGTRVNQNLIIGTGFAMVGMAALLFFVLSTPRGAGLDNALVYFIPRLSFVLVIEMFSYFFLNLYKSGLSDLKFYQNELTGVEARYLATQTALTHGDQELMREVAGQLSRVERNVTLRPSQPSRERENQPERSIDNRTLVVLSDALRQLAK